MSRSKTTCPCIPGAFWRTTSSADHRWSAEDVVLQNAPGIHGHVVLDLDITADRDFRRDHHVLADVTAGADARVLHYMRKMPDFCARPNRAWFIDVARFVYEIVVIRHSSLGRHRTATVTVLLGVPLITIRSGTLPAANPVGRTTLICHNPMNPGASPEYFTSPKPLLPMATHIEGWLFKHVVPLVVGTATVLESGEPDAAVPSVTAGLTCPCPVP